MGASLKGGELLVHLRFNQTPEDYTVGGTRLDNGHLHLIEVTFTLLHRLDNIDSIENIDLYFVHPEQFFISSVILNMIWFTGCPKFDFSASEVKRYGILPEVHIGG